MSLNSISSPGKTILLVEDEAIIAVTARRKLEDYNYSVITANSGEEAVKAAAENLSVNLILMDIDLGQGMDGTTAAALILETRDLPIVFFSSHTEAEIIERTEKIASYGYVIKNSDITIIDASLKMAFKLFEANKKIRESEEYLGTIINSTSEALFIHDPKTLKLIDVNQSTCDMYGYTADEIKELSITDLSGDSGKYTEETALQWMEKARAEGPQTFEWLAKKKNGETFNLEVCLRYTTIKNENRFLASCRDITDRKKTERELAESRQLFHLLIESLPQNIYAKDLNGRFIFANKHYCKTEGKMPEDLIGKTDYDLHPKELAELYRKDDQLVIDTGTLFEREEIHQSLGKEKIYVQVIKTPLRDSSEKIIGTLGIFWDITAKRKAEQELLDQKILLSTIIESASDAIFAKDINGRYQVVNQAGAKMIGINIEKIIGHTDQELLETDIAREFQKIDREVMESGKPREGEEEAVLNGRRVTFLANKTPWRDESGNIVGVIGVTKDITDRTAAEEKLHALFLSMTEMVVMHELVFDAKGNAVNYRITDCNKTFTEITGITKENAVGKLATEVYHADEPPYFAEFSKVAITGIPYEDTTYFEPMDKYFSISAVSPSKNTFATITTDISGIRQAQEALTTKNKELENYLYVASHDLRSPLVNIQGFTQRLKKQMELIESVTSALPLENEPRGRLDSLFKEGIPNTLGYVFSNVEKMDTLLNGLLQISRTGRALMTITEIDAKKLFSAILDNYNFQLTEINARMEIKDPDNCFGDENLLNQLFSNLIGNAIKYRSKERQLVLEIYSHTDFKKVTYSIKDNGIGIEPRNLEKIWNVFYRVDRNYCESGDGLGLSLVKRISEKHHGKAWAESTFGEGSIFHIELPRTQFSE